MFLRIQVTEKHDIFVFVQIAVTSFAILTFPFKETEIFSSMKGEKR